MRVYPLYLHLGNHGTILPAIRCYHRGLDVLLRSQLADPQPRSLRGAAETQSSTNRPAIESAQRAARLVLSRVQQVLRLDVQRLRWQCLATRHRSSLGYAPLRRTPRGDLLRDDPDSNRVYSSSRQRLSACGRSLARLGILGTMPRSHG